jgi:hypothetical protein
MKILKYKWSSQNGTTYEQDIHVSKPGLIYRGILVFYYSLLLNDCDLNAKDIFLLECEYSKLYLRAEDAELRMELRLPAL